MEKIAINFLPLLHEGGTATYANLLLERFSRLPEEKREKFFFIFPGRIALPAVFKDDRNSIVLPVHSRRRKIIAEQFVIPDLLKSRNIRWLHQLSFSIPYRNKKLHLISTIHDLTFQLYPHTVPLHKRIYYSHNFQRSIRESKVLLTDSLTVKQQLLEIYSLKPEDIEVIPLGVSHKWGELPSEEIQNTLLAQSSLEIKKYFLHVGTLEPRKNIDTLLSWWEQWKKENPTDMQLVLVGAKGWRHRGILHRIQNLADVQYWGKVSPEHLKTLYLNTAAVVSLSLYEGFGLPLVEASHYTIPLILSKIPVYEEVRGSSEYMASDYQEFARLLSACVYRQKEYYELLKISHQIKGKYDFDASFDTLLKRYYSCISKK